MSPDRFSFISFQGPRVAPVLLLGLLGLLALITVGAAPPESAGEGAGEKVDFETEVLPVLEGACIECHDSVTAFSNLRLDNAEGIMAGGDLGKVVVPGKPEESPLVIRVQLPQTDLDFMPIEGDPLTEEQIEVMTRWISQGADFGDWTGK